MKRRHFLTTSLMASSAVCGMGGGAVPSRSQTTGEIFAEPPDSEKRYLELSRTLDRPAMERGWASSVDPGYRHAPPAAVDAFRDLKFGIRIHWGLYCLTWSTLGNGSG
jgi:hypothetical protein